MYWNLNVKEKTQIPCSCKTEECCDEEKNPAFHDSSLMFNIKVKLYHGMHVIGESELSCSIACM